MKTVFLCDRDGKSFKTLAFEPETEKKGILVISHGMAEHIERYIPFMEFMADNGFCVYGHDHPGHGSDIPESELGYFGSGYEGCIGRIHSVVQYAENEDRGLPVTLLGHSMGSFMARAYVGFYPDDLQNAIFMGTSGSNPASGAALLLVAMMRPFKGAHGKSKFINDLAFAPYDKGFPGDGTNKWLASDPSVAEKYNKDPRCGFQFTLDGYKTLFSVLGYVSSAKWVREYPKKLRTLLVSGSDDPVGNYGKGVREVFGKLSDAGCDVRMKLYDGARHEILNDKCRQTVYEDVLSFAEGK